MRARLAMLLLVAAACGAGEEASTRVTIPNGATMGVAADSLERAGVIGSSRMFRLYAKLRGGDRGIKAGTYALRPDASWESVLDALRSGRGVVNIVTVPEGYTLRQTEALLAARLGIPADSVRAAVRDTALLHRLDVPTPHVEGYLFPDTYFFSPGTTARVAVETMVRRFEQRWKPEWTARLDTLKLSRHSIMTLASIVEREAKLQRERPVIAAVYWNRLRRGMRLEADPTVQYALPEYQARLLYRHLNVNSPYNTYRNAGLPPGPIGAPGAASIEATLYPSSVPYLYFVAYPDGHHEFRTRLQEHTVASRAARRAWDAAARAAKQSQTGGATRTPASRGTKSPGTSGGGRG
ncbi:MAG: endolytic transglycosylase MltG [Gemmatimonadaceae bacterium]